MKKGTHHTTESRKKLSLVLKGKVCNSGRTHFKQGMIPWNKGLPGLMPEPKNKGLDNRKSYECPVCFTRFKDYIDRKYCSIKCHSLQRMGENNPNWIGGGWLYVRKQVLIEQNHTCQNCGFREIGIMEVNHKMERSKYPELARDRNNLEVLCPNCHRRKTNQFLKGNKK